MGKGEGGSCERPQIFLDGAEGDAATAVLERNDEQEGLAVSEMPFFQGDGWQEQQAEHINKLCEQLQAKVQDYAANDETWRNWLDTMGQIHTGSFQNRLWAWIQLISKNGWDFDAIDDSLILSKTQWKALGRTVKPEFEGKGKSGLYRADDDSKRVLQLRMATKTIRVPDTDVDTGEEKWKRVQVPLRDSNGQKVFRTFAAYHVDATEGEPLPEDPWGHTTGSERDATMLIDHLRQACEAEGIEVEIGPLDARDGRRGDYTPAGTGRQPRIRVDDQYSPAEQAAIFVHEFVHHSAGDEGGGDHAERARKEIATQSTTHIILSRYGLQDDNATFPYLASWTQGNSEKIGELNAEIYRRTTEFFKHVDPLLQKLDKGRREQAKEAAQARREKKAAKKPRKRATAKPAATAALA